MVSSAEILPIFKLPYLALKEISSHMNPVELVKLSLCSQKSRMVAKAMNVKLNSQYFISVFFKANPEIIFVNQKTDEKYMIILNTEDFHEVVSGISMLTEIIFDAFGTFQIKASFHFSNDLTNDDEKMLNWAKENKLLIVDATLSNDKEYLTKEESELGLQFLELFKNCDRLTTNVNFGRWTVSDLKLDTKYLIASQGGWITVDNLWDFGVGKMIISHSSLYNNDVNQFLKDWKSGLKSNPKHWLIAFLDTELDSDIILDEIENVEYDTEGPVGDGATSHFATPTFRNYDISQLVDRVFEIRNDVNGKLAFLWETKKDNEKTISLIFTEMLEGIV